MTDAGKQIVAALLSLPDSDVVDVLSESRRQARLSGRALFGGPPPPSSDAIARALELEELRVGDHYYRNADGDHLRNLDGCRVVGVTAVGREYGRSRTR